MAVLGLVLDQPGQPDLHAALARRGLGVHAGLVLPPAGVELAPPGLVDLGGAGGGEQVHHHALDPLARILLVGERELPLHEQPAHVAPDLLRRLRVPDLVELGLQVPGARALGGDGGAAGERERERGGGDPGGAGHRLSSGRDGPRTVPDAGAAR
ncbi:hypothetical protein Adeh_0513 [Anaeromyxobacter dehalogenans 2CP-C]|uniref:Uncharacterized protein n=1 Tax=Anaeromyxobacter dehalogenans (strain 2CP-C) TaxID=290397 RepID=Q2INB0_ANADE|nr:hypothetical protein Adeh_0513 [Anaeromyxobacter dehalogenans 2CP-C]